MCRVRIYLLLGGMLLLGGCVTVPPKYEVTDLSSGHTFTTYGNWGKENMLGYNFYDSETGERVMLKSYKIRTISSGGVYAPDNPQAVEYQEDAKRAGVIVSY